MNHLCKAVEVNSLTLISYFYRVEPEGVHLEDNHRFEGFAVDLIFELSKILNFDFKFIPVADNNYGTRNPITGEWNGIIRELVDQVIASSLDF